ncbi:TrbI/VirB10 family protein [Dickeya oryzae]|uniref:VirB10/TraB/TrbI family type IV secretion system protein n=1 Tax=Dickeya oryzae TaxID=1240404 RepID=UPI001AEC81A3|nr:VirB10/TraB/TrbI family type IV secretion system protein [Dickeya oryzae]MBP2845820.1 TrbI/VirB10 family protein [Dickeya oryzae]
MTTEQHGESPSEDTPAVSVADAEQEARDRLAASQKAAEPEEKAHSRKPQVAAQDKRRGNKFAILGVFLVLGLIFLGWGGTSFYKNFIRTPPKEEPKSSGSGQTSISLRRSNLGENTNPWPQDDTNPDATTSTGSKNPASAGINTSPPPVRLNRALALSASGSNNASHASAQVTRKEEIQSTSTVTQGTGNNAASAKPANGTLSSSATVRRIPYNPDLFIPELTSIPCSMDFRFISNLSGKIRCTVTTDIYSASGRVKLLKKGTAAIGEYRSGMLNHGQGAVFIIINKLRTREKPYLEIPLTDTQAGGELGEAGVSGWIDNHWLDRFGGALIVGMIPDGMAAIANTSGKTDRNTDYTENSRQSLAGMAKTTLDNSINIPPTLYKNQGEIIHLIIGQDIDFSSIYTLRAL